MEDTPRKKRSAVLVDRHPLWLEIVTQVLTRANIEVQARFVSSTAALERLDDLQTDLLITGLDQEPGDLGGIALIRSARDRVPGLKVIMLSAHDDRERIDLAFAAGADAYVVKTAAASDLLHAVHQVFEHSVYLPAVVTNGTPMPGAGAPRKLNVNNRTEASRIAQLRGLLEPASVAPAPDRPAVSAARAQIEAA
jgi:DNA-binding response OmpR family regulator